jgi:hypothetical protein
MAGKFGVEECESFSDLSDFSLSLITTSSEVEISHFSSIVRNYICYSAT